MTRNRSGDGHRLVYSTETGRVRTPATSDPKPPGDGFVRIRRETRGRRGKGVTTISGIPLADPELQALAAELKRRCATGGAVKDRVIEIQGDHRETLRALLVAAGYAVKLAGG